MLHIEQPQQPGQQVQPDSGSPDQPHNATSREAAHGIEAGHGQDAEQQTFIGYAALPDVDSEASSYAIRRTVSRRVKPRDAKVILMNGDEIKVTCPLGTYTTGEELSHLVADAIGLHDEARSLFSIWVLSESLQLQMKHHYLPFRIVGDWPQLLEHYTDADSGAESPRLYLKRDCMVDQVTEASFDDDECVVQLLFDEVTFNVVNSLYPIELEDAAKMAAIHFHLHHGMARATRHSSSIKKIHGCKKPPHFRLSHKTWEKMVSDRVAPFALAFDSELELKRHYLLIARQYGFYGASFFFGDVEQSRSRVVIQERPPVPVRVGINIEGVHIVDERFNKLVLSLPYDHLKFNSFEDDDTGRMCFFVEYPRSELPHGAGLEVFGFKRNESEKKEQFVVWAPQANMMDALVVRFLERQDSWRAYRQVSREAKGFTLRRGAEKNKSRPSMFGLDRFGTVRRAWFTVDIAQHHANVHAERQAQDQDERTQAGTTES